MAFLLGGRLPCVAIFAKIETLPATSFLVSNRPRREISVLRDIALYESYIVTPHVTCSFVDFTLISLYFLLNYAR